MKRYTWVFHNPRETPRGHWLQAAEVLAALERIADEIQYYDSYENPAYKTCLKTIQELNQYQKDLKRNKTEGKQCLYKKNYKKYEIIFIV